MTVFHFRRSMLVAKAMQFIPQGREAEDVGYVGIGALAANALGSAAGLEFTNAFGYFALFAFAIIGYALTPVLLLICVKTEEKEHVAESEHPYEVSGLQRIVSVNALPLALLALSFSCCSGLGISFLQLLAQERDIPMVSLFFLGSAILMILVRPMAGRETDRNGLKRIVPVGLFFEYVCMIVLAFAQSFAAIVVAMFFRVLGQGIAQSSVQGQIMKDANSWEKGRASATFYMGLDLGQGLISVLGGVAADMFGLTAAYMLGPIALVIGLCGYMHWAIVPRKFNVF